MYQLCKKQDCGTMPQALMERYRVADGPAIKVALFLLNAGCGDAESVADALSLPLDTVQRALAFWHAAGLITDSACVGPVTTAADDGKPTADDVRPAKQPIMLEEERKPLTQSQVCDMILINPDIAVLLQETQNFLGRPLDSLESRMLLEVFEYDELPVDVILMIVAYCLPRVKNKRTLISRVARTATDWKERGIDSAAQAEQQIRLLELREQREKQVADILLLETADFNKPQRCHIARWFEEYEYTIDFVKEAYMRTGNDSVAYINSVLKNWYQNGYKTIRDTRAVPSNAPAPVSKSKKEKGGSSLLKDAIKKRGRSVTNGIF